MIPNSRNSRTWNKSLKIVNHQPLLNSFFFLKKIYKDLATLLNSLSSDIEVKPGGKCTFFIDLRYTTAESNTAGLQCQIQSLKHLDIVTLIVTNTFLNYKQQAIFAFSMYGLSQLTSSRLMAKTFLTPRCNTMRKKSLPAIEPILFPYDMYVCALSPWWPASPAATN